MRPVFVVADPSFECPMTTTSTDMTNTDGISLALRAFPYANPLNTSDRNRRLGVSGMAPAPRTHASSAKEMFDTTPGPMTN